MDKEYIIGQIFTLKNDIDVIIDNEEVCISKVCKIEKGTNFEIKSIENDGVFSIYFKGVGLAIFNEKELDEIIK